MKQNIPSGKYTKISAVYISLIDGMGCTCDNCGRLIANIVTVKHEGGKHYTIGQDCAKTLFSKQENESIAKEIKEDQRKQENAKKAEQQAIRRKHLQILLDASHEAGIDNSNINTDWAREKFNELNAHYSKIAGYQITYNR